MNSYELAQLLCPVIHFIFYILSVPVIFVCRICSGYFKVVRIVKMFDFELTHC